MKREEHQAAGQAAEMLSIGEGWMLSPYHPSPMLSRKQGQPWADPAAGSLSYMHREGTGLGPATQTMPWESKGRNPLLATKPLTCTQSDALHFGLALSSVQPQKPGLRQLKGFLTCNKVHREMSHPEGWL